MLTVPSRRPAPTTERMAEPMARSATVASATGGTGPGVTALLTARWGRLGPASVRSGVTPRTWP
jgi:hypothetical protein